MTTPTKEIIHLIRNNVFNTVARKVRGSLSIQYDGEIFEVTIMKSGYAYFAVLTAPISDFIAGNKTSEDIALKIVADYKEKILKDFLK